MQINCPTVVWRFGELFVVQHLEVEAEQVDGHRVFPGVVLLAPCEEGLSEEET